MPIGCVWWEYCIIDMSHLFLNPNSVMSIHAGSMELAMVELLYHGNGQMLQIKAS